MQILLQNRQIWPCGTRRYRQRNENPNRAESWGDQVELNSPLEWTSLEEQTLCGDG